MLKEITLFELRYHLRKPTPYIYFALFFMLAFLAIVTNTLTGGQTVGRIYRNAPQLIISFMAFSTIIGSIAVAAIVGMAIYRELEHKTNAFFFTLPFSAAQFFFGRFLGSFLVVVFIFLGVGFGTALAASMPWLDPETVAPFNPFVFLGCLYRLCAAKLADDFLLALFFSDPYPKNNRRLHRCHDPVYHLSPRIGEFQSPVSERIQ